MISNLLPDHLDLWGFESEVMVYKDFSLGKILKLNPMDVSCSTDHELVMIKASLVQALNSLSEGARIQFFQEICPNAAPVVQSFLNLKKDEISDLVSELTEEKALTILREEASGALSQSNLYLLVRLDFEKKPEKKRGFINGLKNIFSGFINSQSLEFTEAHLQTEINVFHRNFEKIKMAFQEAGLNSSELSIDESLELIFREWNPDLGIEMRLKELQDIRDQIIQTDLLVSLDSFSLGRFHHKVISLKSLPELTYTSMIRVLRSLPFASGLYLSIEVLNQEKERSELETQRRISYASVVGKKGVTDLDSEAKLKDLEGLLSEFVQGSEKVFKVSMNIIIKSTSLDELDAQATEVLYRIRDLSGAEGFLETYASFDVYKEIALPNASGSLRSRKLNSSVLADFIPAFGPWSGHEKPRVLLKSLEGSLFCFDPFASELSNNNQLVSGGSGSGKSFCCNLLILQMLKEKPKVFILDVGGSYKKLCENLGGQYIELGLKSNHSLNPLDITGISGNNEEVFHQKIKFLVSLIEIMTKESEFSTIGRFEKAEIEKIVSEVLKSKSDARLSDVREILINRSEPTLSKIGKILNSWCGDSPYGRFTDQKTTVELEKDIICFDLKGMETHPDLQAATLFIITDLIWREVQKDRTQMKFCIMDESWRLLQSDSACMFISDIFRTFRKYRASAVAISQTIEDFSKSKIASAILPNSSVKWILRQKGDPKEIESALRLNPRELAHVNELSSIKGKFSEAFLMCEDKRQVVRIEATPLEYWIATTDPTDLEVLSKLQMKHIDLNELEILKLAANKYPQGASVVSKNTNSENKFNETLGR